MTSFEFLVVVGEDVRDGTGRELAVGNSRGSLARDH